MRSVTATRKASGTANRQAGDERDQYVPDHVRADLVDQHVGDPAEPGPVGLREQQHRAALQPGQVGQEIDGEHSHRQGGGQRGEHAPADSERTAAEPGRQAVEQLVELAGQVVPVADLAEAGRAVLLDGEIVGEVFHQGMELIGHGRDHRLQEGGDHSQRHQDNHHDGYPAEDMPAAQRAYRGIQADR